MSSRRGKHLNPVIGPDELSAEPPCVCLRVCVRFSGVCREGERLVVGPTDEGRFLRLKVGSIQRNRSACRVLRAGQAATLALGNFDRSLLRKVRGHATRGLCGGMLRPPPLVPIQHPSLGQVTLEIRRAFYRNDPFEDRSVSKQSAF